MPAFGWLALVNGQGPLELGAPGPAVQDPLEGAGPLSYLGKVGPWACSRLATRAMRGPFFVGPLGYAQGQAVHLGLQFGGDRFPGHSPAPWASARDGGNRPGAARSAWALLARGRRGICGLFIFAFCHLRAPQSPGPLGPAPGLRCPEAGAQRHLALTVRRCPATVARAKAVPCVRLGPGSKVSGLAHRGRGARALCTDP